MSKSDHTLQTISGLKWNLLNQIVYQGLSLLVSLFIMRFLTPSDYGLIGMVTVFTGFLIVFRDFNLGNSIIQNQNIEKIDEDTVFWTSLLIGLLLTILLILIAPIISSFYNKPILIKIIYVLSSTFLLQSLITIQNALLKKHMDFRKLFWINTISVLCSSVVAIYAAVKGMGVWALVFQQVTFTGISVVVFWIIDPWRPEFKFSKVKLKIHLRFGIPMVGSQTLSYWTRNADNLLIGKFLGSNALGLYSRAYSIMMLPVGQVSNIIASVMFPSFSLIQDDTKRIKYIYLKISRCIAFVTFPMMGILIVIAEPFVNILLGNSWIKIILPLQILAIVGAFQSIGTLVGNIFMSQGKTKSYFYVNFFSSIIIIMSFIIGIQYSIEILALAYLIATLFIILPQWHIAGKLITCSLKEMISNIIPHILISTIIISGFILLQYLFNIQNYIKFLLVPFIYGIVWMISMKLINPKHFQEIIEIIKDIKPKK